MATQLRVYQLDPARVDEFITVWREQIVPARKAAGFKIRGAWVNREQAGFVWVISYKGKGSFDDAEKRYYASDARRSIDPSPTEYLRNVETSMVEPLV